MHKIYGMSFASIYQALLAKVERKGRTKAALDEIIVWFTGYDQATLESLINSEMTYQAFFEEAPSLNPNRKLITGVICGVRVEEITEPLMQEIRYLDKLVDELAKGKAMEKILRTPK